MVEWLEQLGYGAESCVSREFEARLRHAATEKLSLSTQQKMGTFFELGRIRQRKETDGLRLFSAVPKIQWDSIPHCPLRLLDYGKPLPFSPLISKNIV